MGVVGNKGNVNAKGTEGNAGNTAPLFARNIAEPKAQAIESQYNAEATYHPEVTQEAFTHLNDMQSYTNQLSHPLAAVAQTHIANAANAHANHNYSVSESERANGVTDVFENVNKAIKTLNSMKLSPDVHPDLHPFIDQAVGHGQAYLNTLSPAKMQPSRSVPGAFSTSIDPEYRARADVDTTLDKKKFGDTYRGFASPDALFQKRTYPAEQAKKAKNYVKPKSRGFAESAPKKGAK
jgi:hypothetical protein